MNNLKTEEDEAQLQAPEIRVKDEEDLEVKFQQLKCRLIAKDVHFYYEPKILPCRNSACVDCIRKVINTETHILKCLLCLSEHKIEKIDELITNEEMIEEINKNWNEITDLLLNKLDNQVNTLKKNFSNKNQIIESQCEKAKNEVSERINDLKSHLDVLHKDLLSSLSLVKDSLTNEVEDLNTQAELKTEKYESLIKNMESIVNELENKKDTAEKYMYECQDAIEDLAELEQNYHKTLRKVSFEPSEWMPDEKFICSYIGNFDIESDTTDSENYSNDDDNNEKQADK